MRKTIVAVLAALLLTVSLPFVASATTIGATTSQTQSWGIGTVKTVDQSSSVIATDQTVIGTSSSSTNTCGTGCTGNSNGSQLTISHTVGIATDNTKTVYNGISGFFTITCGVTAYSNPF